jgi:methylmalonyl-CoA/ethylmalonyl-CoA epimerase
MIARDATLDHVGFVVTSIAEQREEFARSTGAEPVSEIIHDPLQRVRVAFLAHPNGGPRIELVEPFGERSPVAAFAAQGGGLHHLCYAVDDLPAQLAAARGCGASVLRPPRPAAAFAGRRITWVLTRQRLLVEFLERAAAPSAEF